MRDNYSMLIYSKENKMRKNPNLTLKDHLLHICDHTKEEYLDLFETVRLLKEAQYQGVTPHILQDKVIGLLFAESSLRTRVSFETAATQLGAHAEFITVKSIHAGDGNESMRDTAEVLSRMVDLVLYRTEESATVDKFAEYSFCPVINGSSLQDHPTQVIADVFTMMEHRPDLKLEDMKIMFIGDNSSTYHRFIPVQRSMMQLCAIMGMTYIACSPKELLPSEEDTKLFEQLAKENNSGAKLIATTEPDDYIADVDFVITEVMTFKGMQDYHGYTDEEFAAIRLGLLMPKYQVNQELINKAKPNVGVMHCMPGNRNEEITDEVWDGPNSLLFEEAENRLHAQKGILAWFLYGRDPEPELTDYYKAKVESHLNQSFRKNGIKR